MTTVIPYSGIERVESGGVKFGDDWPGLFLRGDDAIHLSIILAKILAGEAMTDIDIAYLSGLRQTIATQVITAFTGGDPVG